MTFTSDTNIPEIPDHSIVIEVLELVGDVCLPLVLRIVEGLGIEYLGELLKSTFADSATPVSDCRICLQVGKTIIERSDPVIERTVTHNIMNGLIS